jgi:hypothetical protein
LLGELTYHIGTSHVDSLIVTLAESENGFCTSPTSQTPVANTCELVSGGIPGYDGTQPAAEVARVRTAGKGGNGGHGGKGGQHGGSGSEDGHGSDDDDHSHEEGSEGGPGASATQDDDQEDSQEDGSGADDGSQEDGGSEDQASGDGPSHDDEVGVLVLPVIASYLASCTAPNTDYSAIVSVSQVHPLVLVATTCRR